MDFFKLRNVRYYVTSLKDFVANQPPQQRSQEGYPLLQLRPPRPIMNVDVKPSRRDLRKSAKVKNEFLRRHEDSQSFDQDWVSFWPTQRTFAPASVPLALRQSYEESKRPSLSKDGNTELMKINNFLHLTPLAITRQCAALKKFCNDWPEGLETEKDIREHFPVTYITQDFIQCGPTIRNPKARIVKLDINVDDLKLENEADLEKLIALARHRYNPETNMLTIEVSACPSRVQNKDYADFLLRALYYESIVHEEWEKEKPPKEEKLDTVEKLDEYRDRIEKQLGIVNT